MRGHQELLKEQMLSCEVIEVLCLATSSLTLTLAHSTRIQG